MHPELTLARQQRVTAIADRAATQAAILWRRGMTGSFDDGWRAIAPQVAALTTRAQVTAAAGASAYLTATARADGVAADGATPVTPAAWAGVDASGRTIDGLLYGAVTASKASIGRGSGVASALQVGQVYLQTMVATATMDTSRSANLTAMTSHRYTHWIRAISAGACSRCAMLAGIASARTPFERHPRCRCTAEPVTGTDRGPARFTSPTAYFQSLTRAEQDRVFTQAGAEAIRAGADPAAVVSARRGATRAYTQDTAGGRRIAQLQRTIIGQRPDGTPILGYTTAEGTTARSAYARRQRAIGGQFQKVGDTRYSTLTRTRLMPETIIGLTDDVTMRQILLRDAGFLEYPTPTAAEMRAPLGGGYHARQADLIRADRAAADRFYAEHGIAMG